MGTAAVGVLLIRVALIAALAPFGVALAARPAPSQLRSRVAHAAGMVSAAALVAATGCLVWAFVRTDATLAEVVGAGRRDRPLWERIAGLWGSSRSSLLLWAAMVAVAIVAATWPTHRHGPSGTRAATRPNRDGLPVVRALRADMAGAALVLAFCALLLTSASPFDRLAVPAIDGRGLLPILRHPAMAIHPPLLYAAQALMIAAALRPDRWRPRVPLAAGLAALTLGAAWAYAELGWGGFWAWDPVENAGLLPCLALLAAVHARGWASRSFVRVAGALALGGAALTRSGRGISVHSFAPNRSVGIVLGLCFAFGLVAAVVASRADRRSGGRLPLEHAVEPTARRDGPFTGRRMTVILILLALVIVAVGTGVPLVARDRSIGGSFFARVGLPVGLCALALLVVRRPSAAVLAHLGAIALAIGIAGSAFGRDGRAWLHEGDTAALAGRSVAMGRLSADVPKGSGRSLVERVALRVDGRRLEPRTDVWAGWDSPLAETASFRAGVTDVQTVLRQVLTPADGPAAALIEVHTRPLLAFVWLGAALLALGSITPWLRFARVDRLARMFMVSSAPETFAESLDAGRRRVDQPGVGCRVRGGRPPSRSIPNGATSRRRW